LSDTVLRARRVARRFGSQVALEPTGIDVRAREALGLIGPNGAGKSTLLALLAGALEPSSGTIERVDGARENLELFGRLEGEPQYARVAEELLVRFEIPADRPADTLSVGNRQRLNVALALLGSPRVLLLDEPTAALDPGQRRRLWETVTALRDEGGSVVFATQNLEELELYADRVAVLQRGLLTFVGPTAEYRELHAEEIFT
jgi:ABC-type multidrug transport system ATPase subunit